MKCECGEKMVPIVYGLPGAGLFRKADKGKVILGGCVVWPDAQKVGCPNCYYENEENENG